MSKELDSLKKPKRKIHKVSFQKAGSHLAYTTKGAASLKDEPYLLKSMVVEKESLDAGASADIDITGDEDVSNTDSNINKTKEDQMTDQVTQERFEALEKKLKVSEANLALNKYEFDKEIGDGIAAVIAEVEDASGIYKALDALVASHEEALNKAKEESAEALEKAKGSEETELQKTLAGEEGHSVDDKPTPKSLVEQAAANIDAEKETK